MNSYLQDIIWQALVVQFLLLFIALLTVILFSRRCYQHRFDEMLQFHYSRMLNLAYAYLLTNIIAVFSLSFLYIKFSQH